MTRSHGASILSLIEPGTRRKLFLWQDLQVLGN